MRRYLSQLGVALLLIAPTCVAQGPVPPVPPAPAPKPAPLPPAPPAPPDPVVTLAISGPDSVPDRTLATYELTGGTAAVAWLVIPAASQDICAQKLNFTGQPGLYTVIAFAISNSQPTILQKNVTLAGTGPGPVPPGPTPVPPGPTPGPPGPTPVTVALRAIAVFDTTKQVSLSAGQRAIFYSETIGPALKALNITWRHFDVSAPEIQTAAWHATLEVIGTPALIVTDNTGKAYKPITGPLPPDETTIIAQAKGLRGQ